MKKSLLLVVTLCIFHFLDFGGFWHVPGSFNIGDVGVFLILIAIMIFTLIKGITPYLSVTSALILFFGFFTLFQIFLANLNFGQSMMNGLIASRMLFSFFSFYLFLFCLETEKEMVRFLDWLSYIALTALVLGIINVLLPGILSHYGEEREIYRFGVLRIYLPAMPLISFAAIWEISKLSQKNKKSIVFSLILLGAHFVRMTRMRLLGVMAIFLYSLAVKKRVVEITIFTMALLLASVVVTRIYKEDVITRLFESSYEELSANTGTWGSRMGQAAFALQVFWESPLWGNGNASLRNAIYEKNPFLFAMSYKADLGYLAWLKAYGLVGVIWLSFFLGSSYFYLRRIRQTEQNKFLIIFARNYLLFVICTSITINHFMYEQGIILVCIILACIHRLYLLQKEES